MPAMMTQMPTKIVLPSTTKMSLNDRFTNIQKMTPVQNIRMKMANQQQMTTRNRRLAQQMGNRPGLQDELRMNQVDYDPIEDRLGPRASVKDRLNLGGRGNSRGRGYSRGRWGQSSFIENGYSGGYSYRGRGNYRGRRGGSFRGGGRGQLNRSRSFGGSRMNLSFDGPRRGRGRGSRGWGRGGFDSQNRSNQQQNRGRGRGRGRRGRGNFRGGRWGRFQKKQTPSREELDNQIDSYMSKTKAHLDADIDHYMADADES